MSSEIASCMYAGKDVLIEVLIRHAQGWNAQRGIKLKMALLNGFIGKTAC